MNRQEVFNIAYARALEMERPAMVDNMCSYRSGSGPCLIGALIKDEFYNEKMESNDAENPNVLNALSLSGVDEELTDTPRGNDFLLSLQHCHDGAPQHDNEDFKNYLMNKLFEFAKQNNLEIPKS